MIGKLRQILAELESEKEQASKVAQMMHDRIDEQLAAHGGPTASDPPDDCIVSVSELLVTVRKNKALASDILKAINAIEAQLSYALGRTMEFAGVDRVTIKDDDGHAHTVYKTRQAFASLIDREKAIEVFRRYPQLAELIHETVNMNQLKSAIASDDIFERDPDSDEPILPDDVAQVLRYEQRPVARARRA